MDCCGENKKSNVNSKDAEQKTNWVQWIALGLIVLLVLGVVLRLR